MSASEEELERELATTTDAKRRTDLLNELSDRVRTTDPQRAVRLSEEAHGLAVSIGDEAGIAHGLIGLCFGHMMRGEYAECLERSRQARTTLLELDDHVGVSRASIFLGFAYRSLGLLDQSLEHYLESRRILSDESAGEETLRKDGLAWSVYGLAGVELDLRDFDSALAHYTECLDLFVESGRLNGQARARNGIGNVQMARGEHEAALDVLQESLSDSERAENNPSISRTLTDIGDCLEALGRLDEALDHNERARSIREAGGYRDAVLTNSINIGRILLTQGETAEARAQLEAAQPLAEDLGVKPKLYRIHELLARAHEKSGNFDEALDHFRAYHQLEKEVHGEEASSRVRNLQIASEVEVAEKESEIHRLRNVELAALNDELQSRNAQILDEQRQNEELLRNILPAKIVSELKLTGSTIPETFDDVTVFFSDFVDFTNKSATLEPQTLIAELNEIFTHFDELTEKYGCERIKTIGDAYLAVCGMPHPDPDHAQKVLRLAQDAVEYLQERNARSDIEWPIRIGVHTGRVVGGVVGVKKYIYDVFGDTINTASRMESNSESMRINVSHSTYELTKSDFSFLPREEVDVKGKGAFRMYFLERS